MSTLNLVQLSCPNCSGALQYTVGSPVASCPYCGSTIALVSDQGQAVSVDGHDYRVLPFGSTGEQFKQAFLTFLSEGEFTPPDVFEAVKVRRETGLFAAVYLFEGTARVSWSASAGFDRSESYVKTEKKLVNGQWVEQPTTATRTVTDWRPVTGDLLHDYRVLTLASEGIPDTVSALVEAVEGLPPLDELALVDAAAVEGYALEPFENTPEHCFRTAGEGVLEASLLTAVSAKVPGDRHKQVSFSHSRDGERCTRLYRPLWLAVYHYSDERFAFAMDGRTGETLGSRPEDASLKTAVQALRSSISTATIVAVIAGILSFFIVPCLGAVVVGVIWYLFTDGKKKELAVYEERMRANQERREAALAATRQAGGKLPRA